MYGVFYVFSFFFINSTQIKSKKKTIFNIQHNLNKNKNKNKISNKKQKHI